MSGFDWFLVAWWLFNVVMAVAMIGRPRRPIDPAAAAIVVVIYAAFIAGLFISRGAL